MTEYCDCGGTLLFNDDEGIATCTNCGSHEAYSYRPKVTCPMTDPNFTPGPWRVNKYGSIGAGNFGIEPIVAVLEYFWDASHDHSANGRLIAAAPELYAALSQLLHEVVQAGFDNAQDYNWPRSIADARAALYKARGERP